MPQIHLNGTSKAPVYLAPSASPGGEKEYTVAAESLIVHKIVLHSHDTPAGAHVHAMHIHFNYQHPDGRAGSGEVRVPDYSLPGMHTAPVSHPAGTDPVAIRDAAISTARQHIESFSPLVDHQHHGNPHSNSRFNIMEQGKRIIDGHHALLEAHARRASEPEVPQESEPTTSEGGTN